MIDLPTGQKLARGEYPIDARLDLHGMRLDEAQQAVIRTIKKATAAEKRCLLVITGKGANDDGALKREFPHWLDLPELSPLILAFAPAQPKHGGGGAFYVLLKRRRQA